MKRIVTLVIVLLALCPFVALFAQSDNFWETIDTNEVTNIEGIRDLFPNRANYLKLNVNRIRQFLQRIPNESTTPVEQSTVTITIPLPNDERVTFKIVSYDMLEPALAARFPDIKNFKGVAVNDPNCTLRFDWTGRGFRGMIRWKGELIFIDPYTRNTKEYYLSYFKKDYPNPGGFQCFVDGKEEDRENLSNSAQKSAGDCQFRTYRLAVATTGEYSNFFGATSAAQSNLVLNEVNTAINRVNEVYERDLGIRLVLINNTANVFYYNAGTDPFTNNSGSTMLGENQTNMTNVIGSANYDIGHVFSTGGGGVASLRSPCSASSKARGVTGLPSPVNDAFYIDYVAHEIGHQFGGNHTFNNSCGGNRNIGTAYEPGSGSTIMAYAGICPSNVQNNSDDYFHGISIEEIANFVTGSGNTCATIIATSNTAPVVIDPGNFTIPKSTPFVLSATASDANANDTLTYSWEQWDNEAAAAAPPVSSNTTGPLFRSLDPTTSNTRYFINLPNLVSGTNPVWEELPGVARAMEFRVTVRDNNTEYGCTDEQNVDVTVADVGPFLVTSPNTNINVFENQSFTVTWDVAQTDIAPVSCAVVDIFLSTDGGLSFPTLLASSVPNTGSANITFPSGSTTNSARIMIKCATSIFFDISNTNFTIGSSTSTYTLNVQPSTQQFCDNVTNLDYTVVSSSILGYNDPIVLSVSNLPVDAVATFVPSATIAPGTNVTLRLTNLNTVAAGNYTITITGNSTVGQKNATTELVVIDPIAATLTTPTNGATGEAVIPTLIWQPTTNVVSYEVQLASDQAFTTIVATANLTTTSWLVPVTLTPATTYYWRVRHVRTCGNDPWSTVFNFTTNNIVCTTVQSTDVPKTISSGAPSTITSNLTINIQGTITDVDVSNLVGNHTYISDLTVRLKSPVGTPIRLFDDVCSTQNNFNIKFDDQATNAYSTIPCPPTNGLEYRPLENLAAFNGQQLAGTWILEIADNFNADGGSLTAWSLQVCYTPTPVVTSCDDIEMLNCGDSVTGNTNTGINTFEEHDEQISEWTGPELVYQFITDTATVNISLTGLSADLDIYLLSACGDPVNNEIAFSENSDTNDELITSTLSPGFYFIMIDGYDGATSPFSLSLTCTPPLAACPNLLEVNQDTIPENVYVALDTLTSTGKVIIGTTVSFEAGKLIRLLPGFTAEAGSNFTARIFAARNLPCDTTSQAIAVETRQNSVKKQNTNATISVFPNPFMSQTTIAVEMTQPETLEIQLFDINGKLVETICPAQYLEEGAYQFLYQTNTSAGVYLLRTKIGGEVKVQKLIIGA